eukprot:30033-Rhodomonas_salina.2
MESDWGGKDGVVKRKGEGTGCSARSGATSSSPSVWTSDQRPNSRSTPSSTSDTLSERPSTAKSSTGSEATGYTGQLRFLPISTRLLCIARY